MYYYNQLYPNFYYQPNYCSYYPKSDIDLCNPGEPCFGEYKYQCYVCLYKYLNTEIDPFIMVFPYECPYSYEGAVLIGETIIEC